MAKIGEDGLPILEAPELMRLVGQQTVTIERYNLALEGAKGYIAQLEARLQQDGGEVAPTTNDT